MKGNKHLKLLKNVPGYWKKDKQQNVFLKTGNEEKLPEIVEHLKMNY